MEKNTKEKRSLVISEPFNWLNVLLQLTSGAEARPKQEDTLIGMAATWYKCACGELCEKLPRNSGGLAPRDRKLGDMGVDFCRAVVRSEWRFALSIYYGIEERTGNLLREMGHEV